MTRLGAAPIAAIAATMIATCAPAEAATTIGADQVVVSTTSGSRAVIARRPFQMAFVDPSGRTVLREVATSGSPMPIAPVAQSEFARASAPGPTLYAPLSFLVGTYNVAQTGAGQWEATLQSVTEGGIEYSAQAVTGVAPAGDGVRLTLSTDDPSGRMITLVISPQGAALRVSASVSSPSGVAAMSDSFASAPAEAFRGFGGRHNALDQHGSEFYNWTQQENVSSGSADGLTTSSTPDRDRYLFPNGQYAAYYVQSSFVSSAGYGFLLDRDEISHWRMDSDRPDAWQTEAAAPGIDYLVVPGPAQPALSALTQVTGRQRVPPTWAVGSLWDREVKYPSDPASQYEAEFAQDIADFDRYRYYPEAYRIEGWQFLPRPDLAHMMGELRARGIHPLLYFRAFVGQDSGTGTDDPGAYDEALAKGYVATHADGTPYTFVSNFNANGAAIDFTNPAAVAWWQGRIRQALDLGADGFMQDFGEQVLADMHFHDGSTGVSMHNRLAVLYHRATREVVDAYQAEHPGRQVFFFTRAGYSGTPGSAAYESANFPGDETTDWTRSAGLASLTTDMLNRAIGGAWGYSADIGGYFDVGPYSATTKELFVRWAEWAALSPLFRLHGSLAAGVHTPWSYDQQTIDLYRSLTALHDRARPLILRLWAQAAQTGVPITRPLWLAYPGDARAAQQDQEWLLGPQVLVAPVVGQGASERSVYFPAGCWRDPVSGATYTGPAEQTVSAPLERLPYFFACGTDPFTETAASTGATGPRACHQGHRLRFTIHQNNGRVVRAVAYVDGRRVATLRGRRVSAIAFVAPRRSSFAVRIVALTARGRRVVSMRRYHGCAKTAPHTVVGRRRHRR